MISLIPPEKLTLDKLKQFYIDTGDAEKRFDVINKIYGYVNVGQSIIFTNVLRELTWFFDCLFLTFCW